MHGWTKTDSGIEKNSVFQSPILCLFFKTLWGKSVDAKSLLRTCQGVRPRTPSPNLPAGSAGRPFRPKQGRRSTGRGFLSSGGDQLRACAPPCDQGPRRKPAQADRERQRQRMAVRATAPGSYSRWETGSAGFPGEVGVGRLLRYFSWKILRNLQTRWGSSQWCYTCGANPKWKRFHLQRNPQPRFWFKVSSNPSPTSQNAKSLRSYLKVQWQRDWNQTLDVQFHLLAMRPWASPFLWAFFSSPVSWENPTLKQCKDNTVV